MLTTNAAICFWSSPEFQIALQVLMRLHKTANITSCSLPWYKILFIRKAELCIGNTTINYRVADNIIHIENVYYLGREIKI